MKKAKIIKLFFLITIITLNVLFVVENVSAAIASFTLNVGARGGTKYSGSMSENMDKNYAIVEFQSVEHGDNFDTYLQSKIDGTWTNISDKIVVHAQNATGKNIAFHSINVSSPSYDFTTPCFTNMNTSTTKCILKNKSYRVKFHNGSWLGGTVSITGYLYGSN